MILLQIPQFKCTKCFVDIEHHIIDAKLIEDKLIRFKHPIQSLLKCEDEDKILSTQRLFNFAVSVLHD